MVLKVKVHAADLQDRAAVPLVLEGVAKEFPRLEHLWVDQGYTGAAGRRWIEKHLAWSVEVVRHPPKARGEWRGLLGIPTILPRFISSGFDFHLNRRDSAARSRGAGSRNELSAGFLRAGG